MLKWFTKRRAAVVMLLCLAALAVIHVLVLTGALPETIVWGGRAGDPDVSVVTLELIALAVTLMIATIVALRVGFIPGFEGAPILRVAMWIISAYFLLNTLTNLTSPSYLEMMLFTPLSAVLAVCAFRLARRS